MFAAPTVVPFVREANGAGKHVQTIITTRAIMGRQKYAQKCLQNGICQRTGPIASKGSALGGTRLGCKEPSAFPG
jgi:hypothetical protein